LKKGEKMVYCSNRAVEKKGNDFVETGCKFKIIYNQSKIFGENISAKDIKKLIEGETLVSKKGHKMTLDLSNQDFFTKIEYNEVEDDDL
jgi:hypothetical protein